MKWPFVSRKKYNLLELKYGSAVKELDKYFENENKEEFIWHIALEDIEGEYFTIHATDIKRDFPFGIVTAYNGNVVVGVFKNVAYYVRQDKVEW